MKSTIRIAKYLALCSAALFIVACANQMEPAKNALDNINATLSAVSADAQKYIPDQFAAAQSKVAALSASFEKKDYASVVAAAPGVLADVNALGGAAAAKKDEILKALGTEWRSLGTSIPQAVTAVQTRIDALTKSKHVPKGVDLTAAKSSLADASTAWDNAKNTFKTGDAADAVTAAKDAMSKVTAAAAALKLDLTPAGT